MQWFVNLATRTKLFLSFGLMLVSLLGVSASAYKGFTTLHHSQERLLHEDFLPSVRLIELRSAQNRARAQYLEMMRTRDKAKQEQLESDIRERTREIDAGLQVVGDALRGRPRELQQFTEMVALLNDYRRVRDEQLSLIKAGRNQEGDALDASGQSERYNRIRTIAISLGDTAIAQAKTRLEEAKERTERLSEVFVAACLVVFFLTVSTALFMSRLIAKPLREMTEGAKRISAGDLGIIIQADDRRDEVGELSRAFAAMVRYLQDMAAVSRQIAAGNLAADVAPPTDKDVLGKAFADMTGYLREMAVLSQQVSAGDLTVEVKPVAAEDVLRNAFADMLTNLRTIHREVCTGANVLAASASEILVSTTQIASGMTTRPHR